MRLLLDTHVYLWCVQDNPKFSSKARALISDADEVYVSSVSIWEAAIKAKLGKLSADVGRLIEAIQDSGFLELPVSTSHVAELDQLPLLHRDPFDRMLIAQAISEPLKFLTVDPMLKEYSKALIEIV